MSLMKFVNQADTAVQENLLGLKSNFPLLKVDLKKRIVIYNNIEAGKVCLLSGGGSGHEPFSTGFVGSGMLSAAVAGSIFASPPTSTIHDAICAIAEKNNNAGVMVIILNYTGDVLNFGLALEKAKTSNKINVESAVISEDCSRIDDEVHGAGKRGMVGSCFAIKICGGMAESGMSLLNIKSECNEINERMATMGAAVSSCTMPGSGSLFHMNSDEVDIGLGIHGEAGVLREKMPNVDELIHKMLTRITNTLKLCSQNEICVIVNNLGSVSVLEMNIISGKVRSWLENKKFTVHRLYSGSYVTSLDTVGFQLCILNITKKNHWLTYLDSDTNVSAWNGTSQGLSDKNVSDEVEDFNLKTLNQVGPKFSHNQAEMLRNCMMNISSDLILAEKKMNELDQRTGDGDAGSTLRHFAEGVLSSKDEIDYEYPANAFYQLAKISQDVMGGTSGALYGILLNTASQYLQKLAPNEEIDWAVFADQSVHKLLHYSKAKLGDRTMVDSLLPACDEFNKQLLSGKDMKAACKAATEVSKEKCNETKTMKARLGRASYVPDSYVKDVDPGAYGVTVWLNAIYQTLNLYNV